MRLMPASLVMTMTTCLVLAQQAPPTTIPAAVALGRAVPGLEATMTALASCVDRKGPHQHAVAKTAWLLLGFAGNGSTLREGPHRDMIKVLVVSLRDRQDEAGRFVTKGEDFDRTSQLLATFAMARCQLEGKFKLLIGNTHRGITATTAAFGASDATPATPEEVALLAMLADTLLDSDLAELQPTVAELARTGAAALEPHRSRRTDAVRHLTSVLLGDRHEPDLTIAQCWPGNLGKDAFHTFVGAFAVRTLGPPHQHGQWQSAQTLLAARGSDGLWPAGGELDATTTSAMFAAALGMTYVPR